MGKGGKGGDYYGGGFGSLLGGNLGSKAVDGSYGGNRGSDGGVGYGKFGSKGYYGPGSYYSTNHGSKAGGGSISLVGGNVGAEEEGEEDGVAKLNSKYAKKSAPQFYFGKGGKGSKGGYGGFFSEVQGLVALFGGSDYLGDTDDTVDTVGFYGGKGGKGSKGGYYGEVEY